MIFIYLLIASIIGISIFIIIEHQKTGDSLLQMIKKLCSIDSVQFEHKLKKAKDYSHTLKKRVTYIGKTYSSKIGSELESRGNKFRSRVRRKLHPKTEVQESSIFIQTMKEED